MDALEDAILNPNVSEMSTLNAIWARAAQKNEAKDKESMQKEKAEARTVNSKAAEVSDVVVIGDSSPLKSAHAHAPVEDEEMADASDEVIDVTPAKENKVALPPKPATDAPPSTSTPMEAEEQSCSTVSPSPSKPV